MIILCIHKERKCGNVPNYMKSLIMHNTLQQSRSHVALFSIKFPTTKSGKTIPTLLCCSDIHSLAIIVSIYDLSH
jgi:hypothetical protein